MCASPRAPWQSSECINYWQYTATGDISSGNNWKPLHEKTPTRVAPTEQLLRSRPASWMLAQRRREQEERQEEDSVIRFPPASGAAKEAAGLWNTAATTTSLNFRCCPAWVWCLARQGRAPGLPRDRRERSRSSPALRSPHAEKCNMDPLEHSQPAPPVPRFRWPLQKPFYSLTLRNITKWQSCLKRKKKKTKNSFKHIQLWDRE